MPETGKKELVINTGPIIALVAALGNLSILEDLYSKVVVPYKVCEELTVDNSSRFAAKEFQQDNWIEKECTPIAVEPLLKGILDPGEAAVIQVATNERIATVCIDEPVGRRVARMSGLLVTGSLGILLRAKRKGHPVELCSCIEQMQYRNIRLSQRLVAEVLKEAGETKKLKYNSSQE